MIFKSVILALIIGLNTIDYVNGICGKCGDMSGVACITPTSFYACLNGTQSKILQTCPGNLICANVPNVCVNSTTSTQFADCPYCGICNADLRFACINSTSFAYCFGTTTPSTMDIDSCPAGQYCSTNANSPNYCTDNINLATCPDLNNTITTTPCPSTTSTVTPSTTSTVTPSTTTAPPSTTAAPTAASICAKNGVGRFPNPTDPTCTQFAYCFVYGGKIRSHFYYCMGSTIFDQRLQTCEVPSSSFICNANS